MQTAQLILFFNNCINFIENKGLTEELIYFFPKADRDDLRMFIETGKVE